MIVFSPFFFNRIDPRGVNQGVFVEAKIPTLPPEDTFQGQNTTSQLAVLDQGLRKEDWGLGNEEFRFC